MVRILCRLWQACLLLCMTAGPGLGSQAQSGAEEADRPEERLWEVTGQTLHGTIEVQRGRSIPLEDLTEIDAETVRRSQERLERQRNQPRRKLPGLRYTVPVRAAEPASPPTGIGLANRAPGAFVLLKNTPISTVAPPGMSSTINEPTAVAVRDLVFATGNFYAALSTDAGDTWSYVNPFTGPFPPTDNGLCCDQVTGYDPVDNAIFFVQEYSPDASNGTHRISVDQGADGVFDCFYDITPSTLGILGTLWPNLPDLAVSDNFVYSSANVFHASTFAFEGAYVVRFRRSSIATCRSSISFDVYYDTGGFSSFKLTRGAKTTMHFADHISNSSLRIWRWPDASASPTSFDRAVSAWTDNARVCPSPDGRDWCGRLNSKIAGAYVADGTIGFMWVASAGGGFPQPYTRVAQFSELSLTLTGEPLIWSTSLAWAYPSVAVNRNGDIGGTIMAADGSSIYPSCVAWIADDVNGDALAPLENQVVYFGTSGPAVNASGDYSWAAAHHPNDYLWAGACFGLDSTSSGRAHYVLFGREGSVEIFADGFESGNTSAWSAAIP